MVRVAVVATLIACCVASSATASYLTMPDAWQLQGQAQASQLQPCGGGQSSGTSTVVAGYPFWAAWDEGGNAATQEEVVWNLLDPSTLQPVSGGVRFQTSPYYVENSGSRDQVTIPTAVQDRNYVLQWVWDGYYSCATLDVVNQSEANGFPPGGAILVQGSPTQHSGQLYAGQMDLLAYNPPAVMNTPENPRAADNPPFFRVTISAPTGMKHAVLSATSWMFDNLDRVTLRNAMPSPTSFDERTDTEATGTGIVGLCRRVNNQQNVDNQQEFFLGISAGPDAAGEAYTVSITDYNAYVAASNDLSVSPHNGPMYFWTDAATVSGDPRRIFFRTTDAFDADFKAELSENCEMTGTNNIVYRAEPSSGNTYCIDLPEEAGDKYIRVEASTVAYTVGIDDGRCSDYSAAARMPSSAALSGIAAAAAAVAAAAVH